MSSQKPATNPYRTPEPRQHNGAPSAGGRRRRTGLLLGVGTVVVVLLAAFGVAGFAYPGWFLNVDDTKHTPRKEAVVSHGPRDAGRTAEGTTNTALDYLNSGDLDGFASLSCAGQREEMLRTIDAYDPRLAAGASADVERIDVQYALEQVGMRGRGQAVADISENFDNLPKNYDKLIPQDRFSGRISLQRKGGQWQLCGIEFNVPGEDSADPGDGPDQDIGPEPDQDEPDATLPPTS
ncbi:hypothetical protein [Sciscionella marina]|uniref:hypothetical protein n=1 Tax=Sciscionella marina TaxID=508770 RepID=UPI0003A59B01|nr:hypothetical protein [Sciscionella marina]